MATTSHCYTLRRQLTHRPWTQWTSAQKNSEKVCRHAFSKQTERKLSRLCPGYTERKEGTREMMGPSQYPGIQEDPGQRTYWRHRKKTNHWKRPRSGKRHGRMLSGHGQCNAIRKKLTWKRFLKCQKKKKKRNMEGPWKIMQQDPKTGNRDPVKA